MGLTLVENLSIIQEAHWSRSPLPPPWQQPYYLDLLIWGCGHEGQESRLHERTRGFKREGGLTSDIILHLGV